MTDIRDGYTRRITMIQNTHDSEPYFDRNQILKAFCLMVKNKGLKIGWQDDPKDMYFVIMFIDLPTGQISYHIPRWEIDLSKWPRYAGQWDGHSTEQKRVRLNEYIISLIQY